jgi:hypothetical protein
MPLASMQISTKPFAEGSNHCNMHLQINSLVQNGEKKILKERYPQIATVPTITATCEIPHPMMTAPIDK